MMRVMSRLDQKFASLEDLKYWSLRNLVLRLFCESFLIL